MRRLETVLRAIPKDRLENPVCYPACDNAEFKWMLTLSDIAVGRITDPQQQEMRLTGDGYCVSVDVLKKPQLYGEPTALVLRASSKPELEGMVLGLSPSRVSRPLYNSAKYVAINSSESRRLTTNLDYLSLQYPTADGIYLQALLSLLSKSNINVGKQFIENINSFSFWLKKHFPAVTDSIWGIKR